MNVLFAVSQRRATTSALKPCSSSSLARPHQRTPLPTANSNSHRRSLSSTTRSSANSRTKTSSSSGGSSDVRSSVGQVGSGKRGVKDFVSGHIPTGATVRYPLASKNIIGVHQARGIRPSLEDTFSLSSLSLPPALLRASLRSNPTPSHSLSSWEGKVSQGGARGWEGKAQHAGEVLAVGLFDGHGGDKVSKWLSSSLAEEVEKSLGTEEEVEECVWRDVEETVDYFRSLGGYYRRWEGGLLAPRYRRSMSGSPSPLTLPERLTLSFLKADKHVLENIPESQTSGSTASVLLLHSLSTGSSQPFFSAPTLSLTVAHVGDTRVLLTGLNGMTEALTESHHAEARVELARLRRLAGRTGSVVDAFGETRWMGAVENTRAFGDGRWKKDGVTGEPQISSRVLDGTSHAYIILVTDGVSSQMSDQEISDLAITAPNPYIAARSIVSFAEDIGGQDNCSAVVVPLAGWTKRNGVDGTKERREWRRKEVEGMSSKLVRR